VILLADEGGSRQCPRRRTLDRGKRASNELKIGFQTNKTKHVL
jgi:hypothetical protein